MKYFPLLILLAFLVFPLKKIEGNSIQMEHITVQDGLFSNRFYKTYRDKDGYLWIIGINGLAKYDGLHITNFIPDTDTSQNYIQGNRFFDIIQDDANNIWVGGNTGLHLLDSKHNTFKHIAKEKLRNVKYLNIVNDTVLNISCSDKSNFRLNIKTKKLTKSQATELITSVVVDNNGTYWTSTHNGLIYNQDKSVSFTLESAINDMCFTPEGNLYAATNKGIIIVSCDDLRKHKSLTKITETGEKLRLTNNNVLSLKYSEGNIWAGTRKGLSLLQLNKDGLPWSVQHSFNEPNNPTSLSNNEVNHINIDWQGIIWISTYGGLNKIDPQRLWFYSLRHNPTNKNSLHDNNIFTISGDTTGHCWIGSYRSGVSLYNTENKQFTYLNKHNDTANTFVRYIYTDNKDSSWIVSDGKLFLIRKEKLELVKILHNHKTIEGAVNAIIKHPEGNYWIGIGNKIVEAKRLSENEFTSVKIWSKNNSPVIQFYVDNNKRIWVGTASSGLLLIDKKKSIIRFTKDNQPTFRSNTIHSICQDSEGNLWVGTSDGVYSCTNNKLFIAKPENISFHGFFKEDGLTHNYVSGILPDENGALWMSTWKGIVKYEPSNTWLCQFTPYTFSDGLIDEKYNRNSIHWDRKTNTYYFGSVNGVNYFSPLKQTTSKIPHRVLISTMVLDDKPIHLFNQENMVDSIIQVNANVEKKGIISRLKVQFGSSDMHTPLKQVFGIKLEGKDSAWTYTRNREFIIHDLKPGKYTLKIKSVSNNGFGIPVHIPIIVKPRFSFLLASTLLSLLIFALLIYMYHRKKNVKIAPQRKVEKYIFSKLTQDKSAETARRLDELMQKEKPYLQPDLTADKLAGLVGVSTGELSQIFNEYLNTRFYEYINKYRIDEFVHLLETPDVKKLTLTALSEKCGFSAKSTFYRAFHNEKGMTPAQFAKLINKKK